MRTLSTTSCLEARWWFCVVAVAMIAITTTAATTVRLTPAQATCSGINAAITNLASPSATDLLFVDVRVTSSRYELSDCAIIVPAALATRRVSLRFALRTGSTSAPREILLSNVSTPKSGPMLSEFAFVADGGSSAISNVDITVAGSRIAANGGSMTSAALSLEVSNSASNIVLRVVNGSTADAAGSLGASAVSLIAKQISKCRILVDSSCNISAQTAVLGGTAANVAASSIPTLAASVACDIASDVLLRATNACNVSAQGRDAGTAALGYLPLSGSSLRLTRVAALAAADVQITAAGGDGVAALGAASVVPTNVPATDSGSSTVAFTLDTVAFVSSENVKVSASGSRAVAAAGAAVFGHQSVLVSFTRSTLAADDGAEIVADGDDTVAALGVAAHAAGLVAKSGACVIHTVNVTFVSRRRNERISASARQHVASALGMASYASSDATQGSVAASDAAIMVANNQSRRITPIAASAFIDVSASAGAVSSGSASVEDGLSIDLCGASPKSKLSPLSSGSISAAASVVPFTFDGVTIQQRIPDGSDTVCATLVWLDLLIGQLMNDTSTFASIAAATEAASSPLLANLTAAEALRGALSPCFDGSEPLDLTYNVSGANFSIGEDPASGRRTLLVQTTSAAVSSARFTVHLVLRSCHEFARALQVQQLPGAQATSSSALATLATDPTVRDAAVRTRILGGKIFRLQVGPFGDYSPSGDDGLLLTIALDTVTPKPAVTQRTIASASSRRRLLNTTIDDFGGLDVGVEVTAPSQPTRDAAAAQVVSGGTVAVATTTAVAGAPSAAGAAQRQALLTGIAECPKRLRGEDLGLEQNPTGLRLDRSDPRDPFGPYRGAIVGNMALIVGFAVLNGVLGALVMVLERRRERNAGSRAATALHWILGAPARQVRRIGGEDGDSGITLLRGMELVRFPTKTVPVATALMQGAMSSGLVLGIYSDYDSDIAIATFVLLFLVGSCAVLAVALFRPFFKAEFSEKDLEGRKWLTRLTMNTGRWTERVFGHETYIRIMGPLFEDFTAGGRHFFVVDLASLVASSYLLALQPATRAECQTVVGASVSLLLMYAILTCAIRPFMSRALNFMFCSIAVIQALAGVCIAIAFAESSQGWLDASEALNLVALVLQVVNIVYAVIKTGSDWWQGELQPDKAMRQVEDTKELLRVERALMLRFAFRSVISINQLAGIQSEPQPPQAKLTAEDEENEPEAPFFKAPPTLQRHQSLAWDLQHNTRRPIEGDAAVGEGSIRSNDSIAEQRGSRRSSLFAVDRLTSPSKRLSKSESENRGRGNSILSNTSGLTEATYDPEDEEGGGKKRDMSRQERLGKLLEYLGLQQQRKKSSFDLPQLVRIDPEVARTRMRRRKTGAMPIRRTSTMASPSSPLRKREPTATGPIRRGNSPDPEKKKKKKRGIDESSSSSSSASGQDEEATPYIVPDL